MAKDSNFVEENTLICPSGVASRNEVNRNLKIKNRNKKCLVYFKKKKCEIIIMEVGLGGRLDSVNILDADCSVITNIGDDHKEFLGKTKSSNISDIEANGDVIIINKNTTAKSNFATYNFKNKLIILSTIDNLIKGGAGQAVQNLNIIFKFKLNEGLK